MGGQLLSEEPHPVSAGDLRPSCLESRVSRNQTNQVMTRSGNVNGRRIGRDLPVSRKNLYAIRRPLHKLVSGFGYEEGNLPQFHLPSLPVR